MIRRPAISRKTRGLQRASTYSTPAPVGGWNARDPLAAMPETDAVEMENVFPEAAEVVLRKGCQDWLTGLTAAGNFMSWDGPDASELFISTATAIYDASSQGAVGASVSACTNSDWSFTNITTVGGHYLIAANGVDKVKLYDGSTWVDVDGVSTPAITGVTTTDLNFVTVLKRRVWFVQKSSMSAWYLAAASVGGAATEFPLGQVFAKGGHLVSMGSWSIDGGDGIDDYTVFISSKGEVALYRGSDPASSTTFEKVGLFYIGPPLNKHCLEKFGGDLLMLTETGLYPLSKALQSASISYEQTLTSRINTAFLAAVTLHKLNPGWRVKVFPTGAFVLVNVPIATGFSDQYVMNTVTGRWCKFSAWHAGDWIVHNSRLFFSLPTKVAEAWTGNSDFTLPIEGFVQQAYTSFRSRSRQKALKLVRPILLSDSAFALSVGLDTDFAREPASSVPAPAPVVGDVWDSGVWDSSSWAGGLEVSKGWLSLESREFYAAAFHLQVSSSTATIKWSSTDFVYEVGGVL